MMLLIVIAYSYPFCVSLKGDRSTPKSLVFMMIIITAKIGINSVGSPKRRFLETVKWGVWVGVVGGWGGIAREER